MCVRVDFIGVWEDYVIMDLVRAWPLVLPQALSAGLEEEIRLIILCLSTSYSLLRLDTLYLDLLISATPGGDYVTPMNNAQLHLICSVFGTFIIVHMSYICAKAS